MQSSLTMRRRRIVKQPKASRAASALEKSANYLRALQTTCKWAGLPEFTTEHRFHPSRKWRFDAAWIDVRLACEIEGGLYSKGRHIRPVGFEKDMHKYNEAAVMGWIVIRVSPTMVEKGIAADYLARTYERLITATA